LQEGEREAEKRKFLILSLERRQEKIVSLLKERGTGGGKENISKFRNLGEELSVLYVKEGGSNSKGILFALGERRKTVLD